MITTSAPLFLDKTIFTIDFDVEYYNGIPYIIKYDNIVHSNINNTHRVTDVSEQSVDLSDFGIDSVVSVDFVMDLPGQFTYPMSFKFDIKSKILKIGFFTDGMSNGGKVRIKFYSIQHNREKRLNLIFYISDF